MLAPKLKALSSITIDIPNTTRLKHQACRVQDIITYDTCGLKKYMNCGRPSSCLPGTIGELNSTIYWNYYDELQASFPLLMNLQENISI
jgi:hypothetical protein